MEQKAKHRYHDACTILTLKVTHRHHVFCAILAQKATQASGGLHFPGTGKAPGTFNPRTSTARTRNNDKDSEETRRGKNVRGVKMVLAGK